MQYVFGLDFGTSKTVISRAQTGSLNPELVVFKIDGEHERIATCLLRDLKTSKLHVGSQAEQIYKLTTNPEARQRLQFFSNFKPHINTRTEERDLARQFLAEIRRSDRLSREFERLDGQALLAAGCPVSWMENRAETLRGLLKETAYPPAFATPEPVGAVFYFLGTHLTARDFRRDVVIFDWGAGTFDMTVLHSGRPEFGAADIWGSSLFGGRLFDDLFYQWLLDIARAESREGDLKKLDERPIEREYLHGSTCREIKEDFSRFYSANPPDTQWAWRNPVLLGAGQQKIYLGDFLVGKIGELEQRMRSYVASDLAHRWLTMAANEVQPEEKTFAERMLRREPVNLQAWGNTLIDAGLDKLKVQSGAVAVLTGGSCSWKWFQDHVRQHRLFHGRNASVLSEDQPELTISRGLARAYSLGSHSQQLSEQIKAAQPKLGEPLRKIHAELVEKIATELSQELGNDAQLKEDIKEIFRQTLSSVERNGQASGSFSDRIVQVVKDLIFDPKEEAARPALANRVGRWLQDNETELNHRADGVARLAHHNVTTLLRREVHGEIDKLVEVAIEACGATGARGLSGALKELGSSVGISPGFVARVFEGMRDYLATRFPSVLTSADKPTMIDREAAEMTQRFYNNLPKAIRATILEAQKSQAWADQVVGDVTDTLTMLANAACVADAQRLIPAIPAVVRQ